MIKITSVIATSFLLFLLGCGNSPLRPSQVQHITITHPNNGEIFHVGDTVPIRWTSDETIRTINIVVASLEGGSRTRIAQGVPASGGEFRWTIRGDMRRGAHKIEVRKDEPSWNRSDTDETDMPIYIRDRR